QPGKASSLARARKPSKCTPRFRQPRGLEQTRRIEYGKRQRTYFAIETSVVRTFGMSHLLWTNRSSRRFGNSRGSRGCFVRRGRDFTFRYKLASGLVLSPYDLSMIEAGL